MVPALQSIPACLPLHEAGNAVSDLPLYGEEAPSAAASPVYSSHISKPLPAGHLAAPAEGI